MLNIDRIAAQLAVPVKADTVIIFDCDWNPQALNASVAVYFDQKGMGNDMGIMTPC